MVLHEKGQGHPRYVCDECHKKVAKAIGFAGSEFSQKICEECLDRALEYSRDGTATFRFTGDQ